MAALSPELIPASFKYAVALAAASDIALIFETFALNDDADAKSFEAASVFKTLSVAVTLPSKVFGEQATVPPT